jgi:hypothetical protein
VDHVIEDYLDTLTPLKQFTEAVLTPPPDPVEREQQLDDRLVLNLTKPFFINSNSLCFLKEIF